MQSLNEELQTVNAELEAKLEELGRASSDIKNLLDSTDIATVFVDADFRVRRFTAQAATLLKLIPGDVGRPLTDLAVEGLYPALPRDAKEVLRTLAPSTKEVASPDGRWFAVRTMPYRTVENRVDGLVLTFTEITAAKTLEADLRRAIPSERALPHG
jgi:two-component system CheB/CheR fusion protein